MPLKKDKEIKPYLRKWSLHAIQHLKTKEGKKESLREKARQCTASGSLVGSRHGQIHNKISGFSAKWYRRKSATLRLSVPLTPMSTMGGLDSSFHYLIPTSSGWESDALGSNPRCHLLAPWPWTIPLTHWISVSSSVDCIMPPSSWVVVRAKGNDKCHRVSIFTWVKGSFHSEAKEKIERMWPRSFECYQMREWTCCGHSDQIHPVIFLGFLQLS